MSERVRVMLLYGGQSSEHEVSLLSARSVLDNLDADRFDVVPVAIDRDGRWHEQDLKRLRASIGPALPIDTTGQGIALPAYGEQGRAVSGGPVDVVFPVMHGTLCEDGSLQGLLETAGIAYVGCGVLASAMCMDKDVAKRLVRAAGLATAEAICIRAAQWQSRPPSLLAQVRALGYPVFVKPANLGSSVGVSRVAAEAALEPALELAFSYDRKVLVERAIDAREIELAVLAAASPDAAPEVSVPGEIVAREGFYSYERKYLESDGAELLIPAPLSPQQVREAQDIALTAFDVLECEGLARVDLFLERSTGRFLFNEVNTIPGFTNASMYAKLFAHSGIPYPELLTRLIDAALQRRAQQLRIKRLR